MDVVAHQAVRQDIQAAGVAFLSQQAQVKPPVVINEEHILPVVAPLRDVMSTARNDNACDSRHRKKLPSRPDRVKKKRNK